MRVIFSTFLVLMFVGKLLTVRCLCVFSAVLSNLKAAMVDFFYKSFKPRKVNNIDLTQQFSLSIFTNFRYQS